MKKLGRKIFREGRCGENVLIVWDHKKVQSLIDLLGGCIVGWPEKEFYAIISLTIDSGGDVINQSQSSEKKNHESASFMCTQGWTKGETLGVFGAVALASVLLFMAQQVVSRPPP